MTFVAEPRINNIARLRLETAATNNIFNTRNPTENVVPIEATKPIAVKKAEYDPDLFDDSNDDPNKQSEHIGSLYFGQPMERVTTSELQAMPLFQRIAADTKLGSKLFVGDRQAFNSRADVSDATKMTLDSNRNILALFGNFGIALFENGNTVDKYSLVHEFNHYIVERIIKSNDPAYYMQLHEQAFNEFQRRGRINQSLSFEDMLVDGKPSKDLKEMLSIMAAFYMERAELSESDRGMLSAFYDQLKSTATAYSESMHLSQIPQQVSDFLGKYQARTAEQLSYMEIEDTAEWRKKEIEKIC
jgi:hypothetical protein